MVGCNVGAYAKANLNLYRRKLKVHMEIAKDHGYLDVDVPRLEYNYTEYVPK